MGGKITIWTFDWVPPGPRGYVRDLRLRWALEEAELAYDVATVPFDDRGPDHIARQPFGQVPFLDDNGLRLFESGACLLHIADKSPVLMPTDGQARADVLQWVIAALNSVEMVTVPWWFLRISGQTESPLTGWMQQRFERLEAVLADRDWLTGTFSVADLLLSDILRVPGDLGALDGRDTLKDYVARNQARPAWRKAHADQLAHFAASDAAR